MEPETYLFVPEGHDFSLAAAADFLRASQQASVRSVELLPSETLRVEGDDWALRMSWLPPDAAEAVVRQKLCQPPNVRVAELLLGSPRVVALAFDSFRDYLNIDNLGDLLDEFTARFWGVYALATPERYWWWPEAEHGQVGSTPDSPAPDAEEMVWWAHRHPPRCLGAFRAMPCDLPDVGFDGHGGQNAIFGLACACGEEPQWVLGHYWANPSYPDGSVVGFIDPLALRCDACGRSTELIDTDYHGYNGETSRREQSPAGPGERPPWLNPRITSERVPYRCSTCGPQPLTLYARFEYGGDEYQSSDAEFAGRWQDLFSWFTLLGRCPLCNRLCLVTEYETA
jgi:hypothetical protein